MVKKHYRFYMDETDLGGFPFQKLDPRDDGLNCFCYAGVLIEQEDIEPTRLAHKAFCTKWGIDFPLHYNAIRVKTGNYSWLGKHKHLSNRDGKAFLKDYHDFMVAQPYKVFGCVMDKAIFQRDYTLGMHVGSQDLFIELKKITLQITLNLLVRKLRVKDATVSIFFEQVGRLEDNAFKNDVKELINNDNINFSRLGVYLQKTPPFGENYPLLQDFNSLLLGTPKEVKKENEFTQIADFCSYPIAKSLYDKKYRPFRLLLEKERLGDIIYVDN